MILKSFHFHQILDKIFILSIIAFFLSFIQFRSNFTQWIKTLHENTESYVMNEKHFKGYFQLHRGTRQSDFLSAYFVIHSP